MLKNLTKQYSVIHIAGREYRVRYSLNALLCLEMLYKPLNEILAIDFKNWDMDTVLHLVHAAICGSLWDRKPVGRKDAEMIRSNQKAVIRRDFEYVRPTVGELGEMIQAKDLPLLKLEIINAVLDSMPARDTDSDTEDQTKATNEGHLRAMYVDIIGRSEGEFWDSTYKEISERTDYYLETKGMKEMPVLAKMYADQ